eukprot:4605545-Heterocapsa_arctica.AAC.1
MRRAQKARQLKALTASLNSRCKSKKQTMKTRPRRLRFSVHKNIAIGHGRAMPEDGDVDRTDTEGLGWPEVTVEGDDAGPRCGEIARPPAASKPGRDEAAGLPRQQ